MITYSEKLTTYDFHAYIDHQLNDDECDEIESRLDNEANVLQELQRCITINENNLSLRWNFNNFHFQNWMNHIMSMDFSAGQQT